jgi:hypothetical protein
MAEPNCGTLVNTPRRSRLTVMSRKKRSTMFSYDAEAGVKCMLNFRCLASHACAAECLCVA